jgi:hypothetical protein
VSCLTCVTCDVQRATCHVFDKLRFTSDTHHASSCNIVHAVGAGIQIQSHAMPHIERCMIMYTTSVDMNIKDNFGKDYVLQIAAGVS